MFLGIKREPSKNLLAAFLLMATSVGLGINGMTLFYKPVVLDLANTGFTLTNFSLYYSISNISAIVTYPIFGYYYEKHIGRMKKTILLAAVITLFTYLGYAFSSRLWQFYLFSLIRGLTSSAITMVPVMILLNNWFVERKSLATSIALTGSNIGTIVFTKTSAFFIAQYGWRASYAAVGILEFLLLAVVCIIATPLPSMINAEPYGKLKSDGKAIQNEGFTTVSALRMPLFWLTGLGFLFGGIALMGVQQNFPTALSLENGLNLSITSTAVSIHMLCICLGKLIMGVLFDKFEHSVAIIYASFFAVGSTLLLLLPDINAIIAYLFAVFFGLGNMGSSIIAATLTADLFGHKDYGEIYGFINMFINVGTSLSPIIAGMCYDNTGSYHIAWKGYIVLLLVSAAIMLYGLKARKKQGYFAVPTR